LSPQAAEPTSYNRFVLAADNAAELGTPFNGALTLPSVSSSALPDRAALASLLRPPAASHTVLSCFYFLRQNKSVQASFFWFWWGFGLGLFGVFWGKVRLNEVKRLRKALKSSGASTK